MSNKVRGTQARMALFKKRKKIRIMPFQVKKDHKTVLLHGPNKLNTGTS